MSEELRHERIIWQAYPSWRQFTWLYLLAVLAAFRGGLFLAFGLPGWGIWFAGALILIGCAALIRRWARYVITPTRVEIRNGYTGRAIASIDLDKIQATSITEGPIAGLFGIGTVVIRIADGDRQIRLRGIPDADVVQKRIEALRPTSSTHVAAS